MVRDGLKKGLVLEEELGFNPMKFGLMASTDTHNSNPGDAEEWDYRGANAWMGSPAKIRLQDGLRQPKVTNPGGLAAVWAPENTRDAIFDAMRRREVYATSGTRMSLRFFGGPDLAKDLVETGDLEALMQQASLWAVISMRAMRAMRGRGTRATKIQLHLDCLFGQRRIQTTRRWRRFRSSRAGLKTVRLRRRF